MTGKNGTTIDFSDPATKNNLLINSDPVRSQTKAGCWTLDASDAWRRAFKSGESCNIQSISLPADVKATTYTSWHSWDNICAGYQVEDIPAGKQDYNVKDYNVDGWVRAPCAVLFSKA